MSIGEVDGYINDHYSLDSYNGFYQIATTSQEKWCSSHNETTDSYTWESLNESKSQVYVLEEQSSKIAIVGSIKDLDKGEAIKSARFLGSKGYVQLQQFNSLFMIDFSSPTEPAMSSEIDYFYYTTSVKDDKFWLTVSQEATADVKISVLNVTDPASPYEVQKYIMPSCGLIGDNLGEYQAFTYLEQSDILIIPVGSSNGENPADFHGFQVYKVDLIHGIRPIGNVTHPGYTMAQYYCWGASYLPPRGVGFNGDLITIKDHSIIWTSTADTLKVKVWELNLDVGRNQSICN